MTRAEERHQEHMGLLAEIAESLATIAENTSPQGPEEDAEPPTVVDRLRALLGPEEDAEGDSEPQQDWTEELLPDDPQDADEDPGEDEAPTWTVREGDTVNVWGSDRGRGYVPGKVVKPIYTWGRHTGQESGMRVGIVLDHPHNVVDEDDEAPAPPPIDWGPDSPHRHYQGPTAKRGALDTRLYPTRVVAIAQQAIRKAQPEYRDGQDVTAAYDLLDALSDAGAHLHEPTVPRAPRTDGTRPWAT